jgi:hypothetical protein
MESKKVESTGLVADLESVLQLKSRPSSGSRNTTRSRDQQAVIDQMTQSITEMKREIDRTNLRSGCSNDSWKRRTWSAPLCPTNSHSQE